MRRTVALRIGILVLVAATAVAPASAAPRDDSPIGPAARIVKRIVTSIRTNIVRALNDINLPKP